MTSRSASTVTAADVIGGNDASWKNGNCRRQTSGRNTFTTTEKCDKVRGCGQKTRKERAQKSAPQTPPPHSTLHNSRSLLWCTDATCLQKTLASFRTCSMELKQCCALQALSRVKGHSTAVKARYKTVTLNTSTLC